MKTAILLEADEGLSTQLCRALENPDLEMHRTRSRDELFERLGNGCSTHLVMANWLLPGRSGLELSRELAARSSSPPPVLIYAASAEPEDRQQALDAGATDFLALPLSRPELHTHITSLLRRLYPDAHATISVVGDIELNRETQLVRRRDKPVHVTPLGYKVLELLMREPGNVYSRRDILAAFGAHDSLDERSVDVHLNRLRRALNAGRRRDAIKTVRGRGYMIA